MGAVRAARKSGMSWSAIGMFVSTSGESMRQRYADKVTFAGRDQGMQFPDRADHDPTNQLDVLARADPGPAFLRVSQQRNGAAVAGTQVQRA